MMTSATGTTSALGISAFEIFELAAPFPGDNRAASELYSAGLCGGGLAAASGKPAATFTGRSSTDASSV